MTVASLDLQQRELAERLRHGRTDPDVRVAAAADAVFHWASLQLGAVCPITFVLLTALDRWDEAVDHAVRFSERPASIHRWGLVFLAALRSDPDPLVADIALLERILLGDDSAAADVPRPWLWSRLPGAIVADLLDGHSPQRDADLAATPPFEVVLTREGTLELHPVLP